MKGIRKYMNKDIAPETVVPEAKLMDGEPLVTDEMVEQYENSQEESVLKVVDEPLELLDEPKVIERPMTKQEELYEIQESKRAPKIQVDQKLVLWTWLIAVAIAFISSAIVSFNGITSVAEFVGLSAIWMAGLFFFFIELMYLIFLVAYLVLASRVDDDGKPEKTWGPLIGMTAFGGIAVLANAFHTLDYWAWDITNPQVWAGIILSISAPVAIISSSKMSSRIVFAKAIKF